MKGKNKLDNKNKFIVITAIALLILILFLAQRANESRQISAAASFGQTMVVCQLLNGQTMRVPTNFSAVDVTSPDGQFTIEPGLSLPPKEVSERINIWTGSFDFNKIKLLTDLDIVETIERILLYRMAEVQKKLDQTDEKLNWAIKNRGLNSLAHQVAIQAKQDLEQENKKLISGLSRLYRLTGVITPPYPCYYLGLETRPSNLPARQPIQQSPTGANNNTPPDDGSPDDITTPDNTYYDDTYYEEPIPDETYNDTYYYEENI